MEFPFFALSLTQTSRPISIEITHFDAFCPNSNAAATAFDASAATLGTGQLITFEGLTPGQFSSKVIATGVTATQTHYDTTLGGIVTDGYATPAGAAIGFNTTPGGTQFLGFVPLWDAGTAQLDFAFTTPVQAWGAYVVGLESTINGTVSVTFNDGSSNSFALTDLSPAGVEFFGFTDPGRSIIQVSLVETGISGTRDIYGVDDIRYVATPEPATLSLLALGGAAVALRRRRKQGA